MSLREIATDLLGVVIEVRTVPASKTREEHVIHAGHVRVAYADDRGVLVLWLETPTGDIVQTFAGFGDARIKLRRATPPTDETTSIVTRLAELRCVRKRFSLDDQRPCREVLPADKASLCCLPCRAYLVVHTKDDSPRT